MTENSRARGYLFIWQRLCLLLTAFLKMFEFCGLSWTRLQNLSFTDLQQVTFVFCSFQFFIHLISHAFGQAILIEHLLCTSFMTVSPDVEGEPP